MKSFKEYAKRNETPSQNTAQSQSNEQSNEQSTEQTEASAEELAKQIARAYNGKSNDVMLKNILLQAEKSKRAGKLSNEEIERFYQSFAPMLDATQRRRLRVIVDRLKNI